MALCTGATRQASRMALIDEMLATTRAHSHTFRLFAAGLHVLSNIGRVAGLGGPAATIPSESIAGLAISAHTREAILAFREDARHA